MGVVDDLSRISNAATFFRDAAQLWWRRKHAERKRGICVINSCEQFKAELRKHFVPHNADIEAREMREKEAKESQVDMGSLQHLGVLSKIFSPINVEEKGLLYVDLTIEGKTSSAIIDTGTTHNFIDAQEAKRLGITYKQGSGTIKVVNSEAKPIMGIVEAVKVKIGDWQGMLDFTVIPMDDFQGLRKDECYVATVRELTDEGNTTCHKESLSSCILEVLDEYRDVMPTELSKKLPPRREVDHQIELELGAKPPAMAPYQMSLRKVHKGLVRRYEGPFPIVKQVGKVAYQLQLPSRLRIHPVVHVSLLKNYNADEEVPLRNILTRAPTAVITESDKEEEKILSHRVIRKRGVSSCTEYLVKWKGLLDHKASWERENLQWQFQDHIQRYKEEDVTRKHEERFGGEKEKVQRWRDALREVASVSGWDSKDQQEAELIERIVELWMHDLLQKMGKNIVFEEAPSNPGRRSRLWSQKDVNNVLVKNKGTEAIQAIVLEVPGGYVAHWDPEAFSKTSELKLLKLCSMQLPNGLKSLPGALRVLDWTYCPLKSMPLTFQLDELVNLKLCHSEIEQLWEGRKFFEGLKFINLSLAVLNLKNCKNLVCLPSTIHNLKSLKTLNISGCSKISRLPENLRECKWLEELDVSETGIEEVPSCIFDLENVKVLSFEGCQGLVSKSWNWFLPFGWIFGSHSVPKGFRLPHSWSNLSSLQRLNLSYCNLSEGSIPSDIDCLSSLQSLNLSGNNFVSLPNSISKLLKLEVLFLDCCEKLQVLPDLPLNIETLFACNCYALETSKFNPSKSCNVFALSKEKVFTGNDPDPLNMFMVIQRFLQEIKIFEPRFEMLIRGI
ncbi:hypothetical protein L6164_016879 [Bauhinia variegata]|uniref:Uncharacterized protein n=1 Tax=Bauhinia variegata TaxID=167791 RepID=A0ACB9N5W7_BAUVA|nr:hypothetical protein L6164_016879 [Bauhinia variegata]